MSTLPPSPAMTMMFGKGPLFRPLRAAILKAASIPEAPAPAFVVLGLNHEDGIRGAEIAGVGHVHTARGADEDGVLACRLRDEPVIQGRAAAGAGAMARQILLVLRHALE